jgi:hypothetical protein
MEYVISEPNIDYCTYVDPLLFLSMVDRGANYSGERKQKGWDIMLHILEAC